MNLDNNINALNNDTGPTIPASQSLPELTIKAIILSIILTIILGAANAFLGLKVGMTISASIPAAIISMGVLRFFKNSNVLENNIVQTAASAGEAMASGVAYSAPALILLHAWDHFDYFTTVGIAFFGGILGVVFAVPLRRAMFDHESLRFPEGTAIGSILKTSVSKSSEGFKELVEGGIVGSLLSFAQYGLQILSQSIERWFKFNDAIIGLGTGFSPAIIAAGFIVGIDVALGQLLGIIIGYVVNMPIMSHEFWLAEQAQIGHVLYVANNLFQTKIGIDQDSITILAHTIILKKLRFIAIGTMLVGGFWTIIKLYKPMAAGIQASLKAVRDIKQEGGIESIPRTERDIPITYVAWTTLLTALPIFLIFYYLIGNNFVTLSLESHIILSLICLVVVMIVGFLCAAICAYMAGLVGTSSSPISGMALIGLIISSFLVMAYLGTTFFSATKGTTLGASIIAIVMCAFITCVAAISNDTMQDLKAGQIVGATPWKQQLMLIVGVAVAALVIPVILQLLYNAYGIGDCFPHAGMNPKETLVAPQASLMTAVVQGVFMHDLPWGLINLGVLIGACTVVVDEFLSLRGKRLPTLAVGLGLYLPLDTSMPFVIGGFLAYFIGRRVNFLQKIKAFTPQMAHDRKQNGLLLACGLVAGSALMGVILAIPFALHGNANALIPWLSDLFAPYADGLSAIATLAMFYWIYRLVCKKA